MLTQIEWWGGLIFVVGVLTHRMVMGALEKKDEGISWYRLQMHAFYLLPALVLAGYFYPLEHLALQYAYLAVLSASLVIVVVMLVQEMTGDSGEGDDEDIRNKRGEGGEAKPAAEGDDEEPGWLMSVVGALVLCSPVLAACGLGCVKAWPLVQPLI
ncbi:MAG: hypothetical protein A2W72_07955 [Burkholderiales bacterium RIFCSPLOWO2_12_67_14]|nr:MAG: hypothetical protein A3I64_17965 [Burkholderiales bacterium RIFCSPLOWO2_02_FULL_67_64]OGB44257.1 MAG: hypothetical protein A2W72_07955 [Burkholderiales bacterium RIFCSPLOWO2_12_67_14]OGC00402.1 MAG: hypothetical protein A3G82_06560 [Burkholderiales bacterium RIFCSPLOWO2_12_FULL_67_210]